MRTRIKICGITRKEDAQGAVALGADALGLVFYPPSPRALSIEKALDISEQIPAFVTRVALFLNPQASDVESIIRGLGPDLLQFHGTEDAGFCSQFGLPYIKALGMADLSVDGLEAIQREHVAALGFLLDSHKSGEAGGTGKAFDWSQAPDQIHRPIVLAGGLQPENVAQAIQQVRPYAVDVSSGVESAAGIKDPDKMRRFVEQVRYADGC